MFNLAHPNLFLIFEILAFISFVAILAREIYQKNKIRVLEILSCLVFGLLLEIGNTYLSHMYSYSSEFWLQIFNVPLAIGCGWTVIIYCAMLLSDQYNIPWYLRPFMDALTALTLDLSLDAIAIRLGFWHWAIPLNQEWYGVPFENLVGWILVVLSFSFLIRYLRTLNLKRFFSRLLFAFSPFLAYVGLALGLVVFSLIAILPYEINNWRMWLTFNYHPNISVLYNPQVQLWKTIVLVAFVVDLVNMVGWSLFKYRKKYLKHFDLLSFIILSALHVFFFVALLITGIYQQMPILLVLGLGMFLVHCLLHFLPYLREPRIIYLFKKVEKSLASGQETVERILEDTLQ